MGCIEQQLIGVGEQCGSDALIRTGRISSITEEEELRFVADGNHLMHFSLTWESDRKGKVWTALTQTEIMSRATVDGPRDQSNGTIDGTPMVAIKNASDPTLDAVDKAIEDLHNNEEPRPYFGMSSVGDECARKLFLRFRWAARERHSAKTLKAFADGHAGEALQAARLRLVPGLTLLTTDEHGKQFALQGCGGHLRGHMDGVVLGLLQAPKTWHVWEHKQVNEAKFKLLHNRIAEKGEKEALEAWDAVYFGQAQGYMKLAELKRHYLTVSTPGGRDTIAVRTEYQADKANALLERCERIIFAEQPPEKVSTDPSFWLCKFCSFHSLCHGTAAPEVSCRTCAHVTPERNGTWTCLKNDRDVVPTDFQRMGCDDHRYLPRLVENFAELENDEDGVTTWRNKLTGAYFKQPEYLSREFVAADDKRLLGDEGVDQFKGVFGHARIVPSPKARTPMPRSADFIDDLPWDVPGKSPEELET